MTRAVILSLVVLSGCTPSAPVFTVADRAGLGAHLAYVAATASPAPAPPAPTPAGDTCLECSGTGRVGDGTVSVPCGACGGTGRRVPPPPPPEPEPEPEAPRPVAKKADNLGPPPGPGTWRKVCTPNGCRWERVR